MTLPTRRSTGNPSPFRTTNRLVAGQQPFAEMPDKLREMQELFLLEAAKYPNLPLTGPNDVDAQQHRLLRDHHVAPTG